MRVVAIIQARMGSRRLPGKVLLPLGGEPVLAWVVTRASRAKTLAEVAVATTTEAADNAVAELCALRGWPCCRGSSNDLLDRYYRAAVALRAEAVVRITSDCPFIDPEVVDRVIDEFLNRQPNVDYASNSLPKDTYPRGLDTEVFRFDALERAWREDTNPAWREHVTPYIHRNPGLFRLHGVVSDVDYSNMRWTVDTPEDLVFVRRICEHFGHDRFSWRDVLVVLNEHAEWLEINRHVRQKTI